LEASFLAEADRRGIVELKGHRCGWHLLCDIVDYIHVLFPGL
jgi:hypothetical protein